VVVVTVMPRGAGQADPGSDNPAAAGSTERRESSIMPTGFTFTGRKRAALAAMTGAAAAAVIGLAVPASAAPAAARPAAVSGTEHFQIMSTSGTSNKLSVIVYGAFTAAGTDTEPNSNGPTATAVFTLPGGSFKVTHTNPNGGNFNPKSCLFTFNAKGTYKLSGGTGKYKGISGKGTYSAFFIGIAPRLKSGACNPNANPVAFQQVVDATGSVKVP
jgi:hypothetical protein